MMHRCSSSQGNMVGPCSCDMFHYHHHHHNQYHNSHSYSSSSSSPPSSFSMLFSKPYDRHDLDHDQYDHDHQHQNVYSFGMNSGVDCTLSLGTPSTRLCSNDDVVYDDKRSSSSQRRSDSCVSNFCWDLLQPKHYSSSASQTTSSQQHKNGVVRGGNSNGNNNSDPLVARRCANCDTTSTPLWRNGPRGPKSLCNACGIRFKKEERRATAAAATPMAAAMDQPPSHVYGQQYHHHSNINPWGTNFPHSQPQKLFSAANEFHFMDASADDDNAAAADSGISFLSWRLNVTDRPSLVHDFTR